MSADLLERPQSPAPAAPAGATPRSRTFGERTWRATWPKLLAVTIAVGLWELIYLWGVKPETLLPGPQVVFTNLWSLMQESSFWESIQVTLQRGVYGFAIALVIGSLLGIAVSQFRVLRAGVGSMITGLQTMPSVAWFPLALLLFGLNESAIFFVIILGAAPSIANGIISGIDEVPPNLLRAGHMLGARGVDRYRYVVLPAAMPSYVGGLKPGWAFAWRSLLAGELLVALPGKPSLGGGMNLARQFGDSETLLGLMIVLLVIGMVVDAIFSSIARRVRSRRGLTGLHAAA